MQYEEKSILSKDDPGATIKLMANEGKKEILGNLKNQETMKCTKMRFNALMT